MRPRLRTCSRSRKTRGRRCFSLGLTAVAVKTAQKKEGKGETTWGDNKARRCCVVNRRWLPGGTREDYLFLFIPPLPFPLFVFSFWGLFSRFLLPCYFGRLVFVFIFEEGEKKTTGHVTRGQKDGPSRHPEKVYPGGEGHERGGRGEGRGQLRQRLYGGSTFTTAHPASFTSTPTPQPDPLVMSTTLALRVPTSPPRLPVPCIPQEVRQGRPQCPLPFPPISRLYMAA